jgi:hypothetical protein
VNTLPLRKSLILLSSILEIWTSPKHMVGLGSNVWKGNQDSCAAGAVSNVTVRVQMALRRDMTFWEIIRHSKSSVMLNL